MILSILIIPVSAYLFYDSWFGLIPGVLVGGYFFREWRKSYIVRRRRKLLNEFKELLMSVDAALYAGYSLENSFIESYKDLGSRFGERTEIMKKLRVINRKLSINEPVYKVLKEFADESELDEIREFAAVIEVVKTSGGNAISIIRDTVKSISERIEVENEISVIVAGKQLEQKIMTAMPFLIIAYLRLSMGGFMSSLYSDPTGRFFMSFILILILVADMIGRHVTDITV
ncbi:MAG: hypothetical protein K6C35_10735 [Eubacterium sp.]|nr:hypothetical protein [Eubacterium sp.]